MTPRFVVLGACLLLAAMVLPTALAAEGSARSPPCMNPNPLVNHYVCCPWNHVIWQRDPTHVTDCYP